MLCNLKNPIAGRAGTVACIAAALRQAMVDGVLPAGEPLKQLHLARHFGVSSIPVREALGRLESEGWIELRANKGAWVRPLSVAEAREIYDILAALECLALKLALPRHTPQSLARVRASLLTAARDRGAGRATLHNRVFHQRLYAPAERPALLGLIERMRQRGERYLRLKLTLDREWEKSQTEHRAILQACAAGDGARARALLQRHLLGTGDMLVRFFERDRRRRQSESSAALAALQREAALGRARGARH